MSAVFAQPRSRYPMRRLEDVATIERNVVDPAQITDGTTYVGLENIKSGGDFVDVRRVGAGELASAKFSFDERHLLFGKLRPYLAKIARPYFSGVCSTDILPVLPGPELDRGFLAHFLLQPAQVAVANSLASGANLPRLSPAALAEFRVPVPPLPEQRRIAEILDQAEALCAKRKDAIARIDILLQSIFLDLRSQSSVGSCPATLADVAEKTRGSFVNGPFGSDLLTSELQPHGVPVIYIRDIRDREYVRVSDSFVSPSKARDLAVCSVQAGDVLVAKVGDPPGLAAIYPDQEPLGIVTQDVIRIRIAKSVAEPQFVAAYLNSSIGRSRVSAITVQATRARFSLKDFKGLEIELPSIELQRVFGRQVRTLEKLRAAQRASLKGLHALFSSLQNRAFRNEL